MKKGIKRIIKEEISSFNFLNSENHQEYNDYIGLLNNQDFQKQFVFDGINGRNIEKKDESVANLRGDWDDNDLGLKKLSFEYETDVIYRYDNSKPIKFQIYITAENINAYLDGSEDKGDYYTAPYAESYFTEMEWDAMDVSFYSEDGDEIELKAYDELSSGDKELFIKSFISKPFIDKMSIEIK